MGSSLCGDGVPMGRRMAASVYVRKMDICLQPIFLFSSTSVWVFLGKQLASALGIIKPIFSLSPRPIP